MTYMLLVRVVKGGGLSTVVKQVDAPTVPGARLSLTAILAIGHVTFVIYGHSCHSWSFMSYVISTV
jgi:hypothetical protein